MLSMPLLSVTEEWGQPLQAPYRGGRGGGGGQVIHPPDALLTRNAFGNAEAGQGSWESNSHHHLHSDDTSPLIEPFEDDVATVLLHSRTDAGLKPLLDHGDHLAGEGGITAITLDTLSPAVRAVRLVQQAAGLLTAEGGVSERDISRRP